MEKGKKRERGGRRGEKGHTYVMTAASVMN